MALRHVETCITLCDRDSRDRFPIHFFLNNSYKKKLLLDSNIKTPYQMCMSHFYPSAQRHAKNFLIPGLREKVST